MSDIIHWKPTGELRWYRPKHGGDVDFELQQRWIETMTGETAWRSVPKFMED